MSILDAGSTIRFTDQGPGIKNKDKAQLPGFSSAIEPMKDYIRGVGSGLPIVRDYLEFSHGTITIEDNMGQGSVVTISLKPQSEGTDADELGNTPVESFGKRKEANRARRGPIVADRVIPAAQTGGMQQIGYQPLAQMQPTGQVAQMQPPAGNIPAQPYAQPAQMYAPLPQQAYVQPMMAQPYAQQPQTYVQPYAHEAAQAQRYPSIPQLNERERDFLNALLEHGELGVTDLSRLTGVSASSVHSVLGKLADEGLVEYAEGKKKRVLTDFGFAVAESI